MEPDHLLRLLNWELVEAGRGLQGRKEGERGQQS
jgi:hypothetical protein